MQTLNQAENPEHQRLVRALIDHIGRAGFEVTNASVYGYRRAPKSRGASLTCEPATSSNS